MTCTVYKYISNIVINICFHSIGQLYSCTMCTFKSYEKATFEAHSRKHVKVKPFKCRICSARFETRELAGVHAKTHCPDFFKCGTCSMTFTQKVSCLTIMCGLWHLLTDHHHLITILTVCFFTDFTGFTCKTF